MKAVLVVYNETIEAEVADALERAGADNYTKVTKAVGVGAGSGPRLDNTVWPGANNAVFVVSEDSAADALVEEIRALRKTQGDAGLRAFWWRVEGMA